MSFDGQQCSHFREETHWGRWLLKADFNKSMIAEWVRAMFNRVNSRKLKHFVIRDDNGNGDGDGLLPTLSRDSQKTVNDFLRKDKRKYEPKTRVHFRFITSSTLCIKDLLAAKKHTIFTSLNKLTKLVKTLIIQFHQCDKSNILNIKFFWKSRARLLCGPVKETCLVK